METHRGGPRKALGERAQPREGLRGPILVEMADRDRRERLGIARRERGPPRSNSRRAESGRPSRCRAEPKSRTSRTFPSSARRRRSAYCWGGRSRSRGRGRGNSTARTSAALARGALGGGSRLRGPRTSSRAPLPLRAATSAARRPSGLARTPRGRAPAAPRRSRGVLRRAPRSSTKPSGQAESAAPTCASTEP